VWAISSIVAFINLGVHNLGLSLILLAALIRGLFWPLNTAQFKAMLSMQKIAPKLKKLQERHKNDQQKLQQETMALYRESGVNPLAGCWPLLVQLPILFSVYWAVVSHRDLYAHASFLWIGSPLAQTVSTLFAVSLAHADIALLVIYMASQYISMRFTSMPPSDPAQAQQLKMMQIISPLMIGFFGFKAQWPSAMVLYWLSYNIFTTAQQFYMLRRYHEPLAFIDSDVPVTEVPAATVTPKPKRKTKGA